MQGGSFRLPNGNTIISKTHVGEMLEVDHGGEILWEYMYESDEINSLSFWIARAKKYSLDYLDNSMFGDINNDGIINVLDIVSLVNIILYSDEYNSDADVNSDGVVNVLDVVLMVTVILNGLP